MKSIVDECMRLTRFLVDGAREMGIEPVIEPVMNVVTLQLGDADRIASALRAKGWEVSTTRSPKSLRLVIMPHVTEDMLRRFMEDLGEVVN